MTKRLDGKVAVITGAGSGIGEATAMLFARHGARLILAGIPDAGVLAVADAITRTGGEARAVPADVTDPAQMKRLMDLAVEAYGRIDVLFNNAGVSHDTLIEDTSEEEWDFVLDVTLKGVFLGCKYAVPHMKRSGGGVIVNSGSTAGNVGFARRSAYCAAKGGVISLTRALAVEVARENIRVNAILPGATDTPLVREQYALAKDPAAARDSHIQRQPVGRLSQPADIARAVLFLASDEAEMMTGATLTVDGGYTAA